MTITVFAHLCPKAEHAPELEQMLRVLLAASRKEPGNRQYDLYRSAEAPIRYHLVESYADQAALEAHRASAHYLAYRKHSAELLAEPVAVSLATPVWVA